MYSEVKIEGDFFGFQIDFSVSEMYDFFEQGPIEVEDSEEIIKAAADPAN